jgi:hypothetical protein
MKWVTLAAIAVTLLAGCTGESAKTTSPFSFEEAEPEAKQNAFITAEHGHRLHCGFARTRRQRASPSPASIE